MNLARAVEYAVQIGRSRIVPFERLIPLTGFGVAEFGIGYLSSALLPLFRRLCLLRRGFPLLSRVSNVPGFP